MVIESDSLFSSFKRYPDLLIVHSSREDGNLKVYHKNGKDVNALINSKKFLNKLGLVENQVVSVRSVHGDNISIVTEKDGGSFIDDTDGLITSQKDVFLSITVADCLPVIVFDPLKEIVSLIHCGWKGLDKKIIEKTIKKMRDNFHIYPEELIAGIGPGIGRCHFEVKEDLLVKFRAYPEAMIKRDRQFFVDLKLIAKRQLEDCGIDTANIEVSPVCTYCQSDIYFSHRKDATDPPEAMSVIIGVR